MKLLFCQMCGDIIAPNPAPRVPRWCRCGLHAIWWENPHTGVLRLHERGAAFRPESEGRHGWSRKLTEHRAYVIGLNNSFLLYPHGHSKESIRRIIAETPPSYLFKTQETSIIRIRPGESNDTDWAEELPAA